jgi:Raf kinase inhibitor-like YbhB/YbcL family protein
MRTRLILTLTIVVLVCLLAIDFVRQRHHGPREVQAGESMQLKSTSFLDSAGIPSRYTCDGAGVSPNLQWSGSPESTRSFALIMHDPDAPVDFTHWLVYNIPPDAHELPEGASPGSMPKSTVEGTNGFRAAGYGGPCPPGGKPHHYHFLIYALDAKLDLPSGATRQQLESAMKGHIVASGRIVGAYKRGGE